jgi:hypothetical protein
VAHGAQSFHFLIANGGRIQRDGRFHRHQCQQLQHVVGHHVAQGAAGFIVAAAPPDTDFFGHHNLHVVDVAIVPQRFPDGVGKAQRQNVLHRFLPR